MTGIELTERLIQNITKSIAIRNSVPDLKTQILNAGNNDDDMSNFISAANALTFDSHLNVVVQILNGGNLLITHQSSTKLDLNSILADIIAKREEISEKIQNILDNNGWVSISDFRPISNTLVEQLEKVNSYAR